MDLIITDTTAYCVSMNNFGIPKCPKSWIRDSSIPNISNHPILPRFD